MTIDFRNTNTLWASILAETLQRLGLTTAVICPGSRSAPLTIAFAQNNKIESIPILDERSASFFALGIAKKSGLPTALICTSGTAAANFYPAIIEARESRIPLLIFTADRPPELRDCHAGQAIDQVKIYGNYPNWQVELAIPSAEIAMLGYLRQTIIYAWDRSQFPTPGPVHLNIPFRDPLVPVSDIAVEALEIQFDSEDFFAGLEPIVAGETSIMGQASCFPISGDGQDARTTIQVIYSTIQKWQQCSRGIIIAGVAQPQFAEKYCSAIAQMSKLLNWPVLAEGLSPLRNYAKLNPHLISTYDLILRNRGLAHKLTPEIAIQIGDLPTSKELRNWLDKTQPKRYIIDPSHHNLDPLHGKAIHLRTSPENLATLLTQVPPLLKGGLGDRTSSPNEYLQLWHNTETQVRQTIDQKLSAINNIIEPKISWLLSQNLPAGTPIFISNSMPVRDVEFFWKPNNLEIKPFFNRGANGIDGTLSTAMGVAHHNQSSILLTGDLALLHDTNGFLIKYKFVGHLTIVLINNNGGGIFEMLPVAKFDPPFEEFFATPQHINFAQLCATYRVEHEIIDDWEQLKDKLSLLPNNGIRVLELQTDRRADAKWRQNNLRN
ncbi:2-succinyl-5-enolpyruvyl-6-hydroxy-3-cyclohexene-1-carboxylic-acid synthase [Tychonema sp. BBK16]|uniref:2-succinyl-5-enolpyruvyl-6-hydroxy-3- cyclohexene-1-carboxylic-acid synthase n=1 Tax=Tychonema sp. BBK16 TaxID=2699888 RepID=UPI001F3242DD|nr:2-succinyl-5-enolpyruvyl-6-hydroxy-3-cyclohexene-1-carboxylic-acid synthase [Tychonema sp. BBK16]MCF6372913.1 2-succinyl-5-enolpyruvyl-6-hydroxy-3-cyclohexene-1-carboxylic-acid synthase [Tychonema sp. BBK16]